MTKKNLNEEDLNKVSGGEYDVSELINVEDYKINETKRMGHCKYCNCDHELLYVGNGEGWWISFSFYCALWKCEIEGQINYYTLQDGKLL